MNHLKLWLLINTFFITIITTQTLLAENQIPTTLDGPFKPVTRRFDPSLRRGSDDLPMNHPRLKKNATSNFPEQISIAISSPTSMWVSWVTGIFLFNYCLLIFLIFFFLRFCNVLFGVMWLDFWVMVWFPWIINGAGEAQIGSDVIPLDPASVASEVWYGKESGKYESRGKGNSTVYTQLYPFEGLSNYTSGIIHHVRIDGKLKKKFPL
jgi:hypothetical protein